MFEIRPAHAPAAQYGSPYEFHITPWNGIGPFEFKALTDLPEGLLLGPKGSIWGTPTGPGGVVAVQVTDKGADDATATAGYTIDVNGSPPVKELEPEVVAAPKPKAERPPEAPKAAPKP